MGKDDVAPQGYGFLYQDKLLTLHWNEECEYILAPQERGISDLGEWTTSCLVTLSEMLYTPGKFTGANPKNPIPWEGYVKEGPIPVAVKAWYDDEEVLYKSYTPVLLPEPLLPQEPSTYVSLGRTTSRKLMSVRAQLSIGKFYYLLEGENAALVVYECMGQLHPYGTEENEEYLVMSLLEEELPMKLVPGSNPTGPR